MTRRTMSFAAALVLGGLATVIMGQSPPDQMTPGYKFGILNCGCLANDNATEASCRQCCRNAAYQHYTLPPEHLDDCFGFCGEMGQPCGTTCVWWRNPFCLFINTAG